jgi:hypothetical protein
MTAVDLSPPSRHYYSLEGVEILFMRWEIAFQRLQLVCASLTNITNYDCDMMGAAIFANGSWIFAFTVQVQLLSVCNAAQFAIVRKYTAASGGTLFLPPPPQ